MADEPLAVRDSLEEMQRTHVFATLRERAANPVRADRDVNASNFTNDRFAEHLGDIGTSRRES